MNPRYQPGGDKYEELKDELLSREEQARYERERDEELEATR